MGESETGPAESLRIALFSGNYNYVRDGANQALNRLVGHLENKVGAAVRVYSPTVSKPAFEPTGTLISVPSISIPGRAEYRLALGLPASIKKNIADFKPNIFHLSAPDILGIKAMKFARSLGVPVVTSLHTRFETYVEHYGLRWIKPAIERHLHRFYSGSDLILAPTPPIVSELESQGMAGRVKLWGRGVDPLAFNPDFRSLEWRRERGFADDDVVILFFGRLVREKGLSLFANVVLELVERGVVIKPLLIGDGPDRRLIAAKLQTATFTGHLSGQELGRAVASADIFLNPSTTEAFGNVTLEAMASGLAIVSADVPSASSLISDIQTGVLCPPTDTPAYVDAVGYLVSCPERRMMLGKNAYEASKRLTWDSTLAVVADAYRELLFQASHSKYKLG
ncbi:glycosyltransferase family 4 protein [Sphingorhabdus sp.]|uniref:glycosyltransferase family 4 protein n=1 Tax=Sphingorhabdus sp. TaxID=1902408 RepID=UPI002FD9DD60